MHRSSLGTIVAAAAGLELALAGGVLVIIVAMTGGVGFTGACRGPGGPAYRSPSGTSDSADQMANARTIVTTTASLGAPKQAAVDALAAAMQESRLRNLNYGDRDSLGLFQQRASWGSATAREDPHTATRMFLLGGRGGQRGLLEVPGWQHMPVTRAVQAVQHSARPNAYARWAGRARTFAQRFWPSQAPTDGNRAVLASYHTGPSRAGVGATITPGAGAIACPGQGGAATGGTGTGHLPAGWAPPTNAQRARVVAFARAQVGKPYVWGAEGPTAFDCSGLTMKAWEAAGVVIPRTTQGQQSTGAPVPGIAALKPGDLIFLPGSDGSASDPGHVGIYIGHGALIDAPHTGTDVQIEKLSAWKTRIVRIRRPSANPAEKT